MSHAISQKRIASLIADQIGDSFISGSSFNQSTGILTLTFSDGNTIDINMGSLLDAAFSALKKCDNTQFNPATDRILSCDGVVAALGSLLSGARGVLGGTGNPNTYVGADGALHLLPLAPVLGSEIALLPSGVQGVLGGTGTPNEYVGADGQLHALPPAITIPPTTNLITLTQSVGLASTVDGVTSSVPVPADVVVSLLGYDALGNPAYQPVASVVSAFIPATTNTIALTQASGLGSVVNGVTSTVAIPAGTVVEVLGFDASGNPVHQPQIIIPPTTNSLLLGQAGGLTSTVNGVTSTVTIPAGVVSEMVGFDAAGNPVRQAPPVIPPAADFWRAGGVNLPDGVADLTEAIRRDGNVGINADPVSTLDVAGSLGTFARLNDNGVVSVSPTDHTVILSLASGQAVTLPAASAFPRRQLRFVNPTANVKSISTYTSLAGGPSTTIAGNSSLTVQSDGIGWYQTVMSIAPSTSDFWRSGAGAANLPDGVTDLTEAIRRNGDVGINADPASMLDVAGSFGTGCRLNDNFFAAAAPIDHTVILNLASAQQFTLPAASATPRRELEIINPTSIAKVTVGTYLDLSLVASTVIPANGVLRLQSDGANWYQTNTAGGGNHWPAYANFAAMPVPSAATDQAHVFNSTTLGHYRYTATQRLPLDAQRGLFNIRDYPTIQDAVNAAAAYSHSPGYHVATVVFDDSVPEECANAAITVHVQGGSNIMFQGKDDWYGYTQINFIVDDVATDFTYLSFQNLLNYGTLTAIGGVGLRFLNGGNYGDITIGETFSLQAYSAYMGGHWQVKSAGDIDARNCNWYSDGTTAALKSTGGTNNSRIIIQGCLLDHRTAAEPFLDLAQTSIGALNFTSNHFNNAVCPIKYRGNILYNLTVLNNSGGNQGAALFIDVQNVRELIVSNNSVFGCVGGFIKSSSSPDLQAVQISNNRLAQIGPVAGTTALIQLTGTASPLIVNGNSYTRNNNAATPHFMDITAAQALVATAVGNRIGFTTAIATNAPAVNLGNV